VLRFKGLMWIFAQQELRGMYAQTYFGLFWAIIRPLFTLAIFTVIFRFFLKVPTQSPYYLFAFTGMIGWNLFSQIAINASTAILQKQSIIRKMYFPKIVLLFSKVIIAIVEAGVSLMVLLGFMLYEKVPIGFNFLTLPFFVLFTITCGLSIAAWMNALNIRFRDFNQIIPTIIGIGVWLTPIFYPTTIIPKNFNFFVYANPMSGIIKGYRYALLGEPFPEQSFWWAIGASFIIALAGLLYFSMVEDRMVDYA
jgi:lipopolysaccharide transport system permease protein